MGNYGYTQQVAGSTISVQSTPVDPPLFNVLLRLHPFDLTTVSNAALQFPPNACYDLPAEGVSFVRHPVKYGNSVSNSILTVHGSGLVSMSTVRTIVSVVLFGLRTRYITYPLLCGHRQF